MSAGLYIAAMMAKDLDTLLSVQRDPAMLEKAAAKYGITTEYARFYLNAEIAAKRAGK